MAKNDIPMGTFIRENDSLPSAPIWTIPADSTVTTDEAMLLSDRNINMLNGNSMPTPSAPAIGDAPPNYFDISIVPKNVVLHYNEVTPYIEASKAEIQRNTKGVLSFDPLIDHNSDQLWLYFMTYLNEKPQFKVDIYGYYTETDSASDTTRIIPEFQFLVDLTPYICHQWWRVAVIPSDEALSAGEIVSLRDALEQYTLSNNKIKDIVLKKQIHGWDFNDLQSKLLALVRSTGYENNINITYQTSNYKIAAQSSSKLSAFANSGCVRALCCITCLCIIFGPIYCCLRSLGSTRDRIVAEYTMMKTPDIFLQLNGHAITAAVTNRSFQSFTAYFD